MLPLCPGTPSVAFPGLQHVALQQRDLPDQQSAACSRGSRAQPGLAAESTQLSGPPGHHQLPQQPLQHNSFGTERVQASVSVHNSLPSLPAQMISAAQPMQTHPNTQLPPAGHKALQSQPDHGPTARAPSDDVEPSENRSTQSDAPNAKPAKSKKLPMPQADVVRVIAHAGPSSLYVVSDQGWLHRLDVPRGPSTDALSSDPAVSSSIGSGGSSHHSLSLQQYQAESKPSIRCGVAQSSSSSCPPLHGQPAVQQQQQQQQGLHWQKIYQLQGGHRSPPICMVARPASASATAAEPDSLLQHSASLEECGSAPSEPVADIPSGDPTSHMDKDRAAANAAAPSGTDHVLIGDRAGTLHLVLIGRMGKQHSVSGSIEMTNKPAGLQNSCAPSTDPMSKPGQHQHGRACAWAAHAGVPVVAVNWAPALGPGALVSAANDGVIRLWNVACASDGNLQVKSCWHAPCHLPDEESLA